MNMKKTTLSCLIIFMILLAMTCSKAPGPFPQASNRIVVGEFFTHDM
jgi:hypothetical protein